jgi:pimeloyl-ACP methyl ester carboxylesterase
MLSAYRSVFFRRYVSGDGQGAGHWSELGRAAAKDLPDCELAEIQNAGHVPHVEQPERFQEALSRFLADRF